jgi:flagellar biosynthesis/type III secretory pathway chaperone
MQLFSPEQQEQLRELLGEQVDCLQQLQAALEYEHQALVDIALEDIATASKRKQAILEAIEQSLDKRHRWLSITAPQLDYKQLEATLIAGEMEQTPLANLAHAVKTLSDSCKEANINNGMLIRKKEETTRRALRILRPSMSEATYSHTGATSSNDCRALGQA